MSPPWLGGKWLRGDDYLVHFAIPNFFFHVTTAYAILRHNGVDLGKLCGGSTYVVSSMIDLAVTLPEQTDAT